MSDKIPTWEELEASGQFDDYGSMFRHLCKLQVKAALLKAAKTKVWIQEGDREELSGRRTSDQKSILSAYDLNLIQ